MVDLAALHFSPVAQLVFAQAALAEKIVQVNANGSILLHVVNLILEVVVCVGAYLTVLVYT